MDQDKSQNLVLEHKRLKENLASLRNLVESYDSNELHSKPAYQVNIYFSCTTNLIIYPYNVLKLSTQMGNFLIIDHL